MLNVLVTGGTGFVGQALVEALVAAGHAVRATTRDLSRAAKAAGVEWASRQLARRTFRWPGLHARPRPRRW